ncbi:hypothetical protein OBBRIDRAFT_199039 [Obba rivulosa]|uniref:Uncharacterized protein n=1 Tax=Obba rivulosa TaxID=1052685 RepID=A0A8E2J404_9APHY|nr:hypothetical protein OBBRIDRAFT_199039 [Obba rivulosa]
MLSVIKVCVRGARGGGCSTPERRNANAIIVARRCESRTVCWWWRAAGDGRRGTSDGVLSAASANIARGCASRTRAAVRWPRVPTGRTANGTSAFAVAGADGLCVVPRACPTAPCRSLSSSLYVDPQIAPRRSARRRLRLASCSRRRPAPGTSPASGKPASIAPSETTRAICPFVC